jgi:hypothetical protein
VHWSQHSCEFPHCFDAMLGLLPLSPPKGTLTNLKGEDRNFMRAWQKLFFLALAMASLAVGARAQSGTATQSQTPQPSSTTASSQNPISAADIQALQDGLTTALKQIQELKDELHRRDQAVQQAQTTAADAAVKAEAAQQQATAEVQTVSALRNDVADLKSVSTGFTNPVLKNAVLTAQDPVQAQPDTQVYNKEMEGPLTIRFKGINVTPGGFAEAAFVRRSRALGADLPTPFNSLTMPGSSQSQLSEFFGSARQSRPTVFVEGRLANVDLSSYISGDFLSAGVTSTATQTNSYTFRLRQVWGQAKFGNGWSFLGGQAWSLVTENRAGIAPSDDTGRTNDARPMTIDPGYNVGFSFARQYGIRLTKRFGNTVAIAFAMENPQATVTSHGNANNYLLVQPGASNSYNSTATYGFNPSPDLIAKIAFDPGFGHYEIFGLADRFTDRIFPCEENFASAQCGTLTAPSAILAYNASKEGGGFGANARWRFAKGRIVFGLHAFGGSGVGRYGAGQLSDVSINPDGTIHLIREGQGLGTLEWHGKKLDIYAYGGAEYASRTWGIDTIPTKPVEVGYGAPGFNNTGCYNEVVPGTSGLVSGPVPGTLVGCTADTRALIEGTIGFWYRFYSGPRGKFQFGTQYSYVTRNAWSGVGGLPSGSAGLSPNGLDGMVFTSFRYYLP